MIHDGKVCRKYAFGRATYTLKCAGAPQKIMWIADNIWRDSNIDANIYFHTATPAIFGVPKYAQELMKLVKSRNISFSKESNLIAVDHLKSK